MPQLVLVIGSPPGSDDVVRALRARGIEAWADRIGRVSLDFISFDWADALVVIDETPHVECRHVRPIMEFRGAKLLAATAALEPEQRAQLLDGGFDGVLHWPTPVESLAALVDRFLSRSALPRWERLQA